MNDHDSMKVVVTLERIENRLASIAGSLGTIADAFRTGNEAHEESIPLNLSMIESNLHRMLSIELTGEDDEGMSDL